LYTERSTLDEKAELNTLLRAANSKTQKNPAVWAEGLTFQGKVSVTVTVFKTPAGDHANPKALAFFLPSS